MAESEDIMTFAKFKSNRELNINELKEVLLLMEQQETTDAEKDTQLRIDGDYALIEVDVDEDGDVTVL